MRSTIGMHQFAKPPFEPNARYVAAKELTWGTNEIGYVTIPAALKDRPETMRPIDFERMKPPWDLDLVARLYRTGFLAMLLTDDGKPLIKFEAEPTPEPQALEAAAPEPDGAVCPKCGKQFKSRHVPHFHIMHCGKKAAA